MCVYIFIHTLGTYIHATNSQLTTRDRLLHSLHAQSIKTYRITHQYIYASVHVIWYDLHRFLAYKYIRLRPLHYSGLSEAHCSSLCCHCPDSQRLRHTLTQLMYNTWPLYWYTPAKGEGKSRDHTLVPNLIGHPRIKSDQSTSSVFLSKKSFSIICITGATNPVLTLPSHSKYSTHTQSSRWKTPSRHHLGALPEENNGKIQCRDTDYLYLIWAGNVYFIKNGTETQTLQLILRWISGREKNLLDFFCYWADHNFGTGTSTCEN